MCSVSKYSLYNFQVDSPTTNGDTPASKKKKKKNKKNKNKGEGTPSQEVLLVKNGFIKLSVIFQIVL